MGTPKNHKTAWHLYVLLCADGSFYTGITKDIQRRLGQHASGKGAKYTRSRAVRQLVHTEIFSTHSGAAAREFEIKKMTHAEKAKLVKA